MNHEQILQGVLEYIDEHIHGELSADALAAVAGFSSYHFQKVFQWNVGYSVMEYVRSRRLAYAAAELATGRRIIDIALDYGFETHSGFSKAFRRRFGCAPEVYRLHAHFFVPSRPSLAHTHKYSTGGIVMEPRFVQRPQTRLFGYLIKTRTQDGENAAAIPAFWRDYMADGRMKRLHSEGALLRHDEYGACFPQDENGEFEYMIGVELRPGAQIPQGYEVRELPAATYAVFASPPSDQADFVTAIQGTWNYIFNEWFPSSGYEFAAGCADYELYGESCMGASGKVCEIHIPVTRKA